jgi:hypothetical protein
MAAQDKSSVVKKTLTIMAALTALAVSGLAQDRDVASLHQFNFLCQSVAIFA